METFETIRPYLDAEVQEVLSKHKDSPIFHKLIKHIYPSWSSSTISNRVSLVDSTDKFQESFIFPGVKAGIDRSMENISISGFENLSRDENYLFISNHRDIIFDSTLMFYILYQNEYKAGETAIGSNLLSSELVTDIVKLNQSFTVSRNLPTREMITKSKELSRYMRYVLQDKKKSIWISHREGRTKDGNDKTNPGVLKMISMDCNQSKIDYLLSLKIVPVSLSYEYDSCDSLKANELTEIELTGSYKKDGTEDMKSIITGITQQKGRVHLAFGKQIEKSNLNLESDRIQDHFKELSREIDRQIHKNFKLFPGNFMAHDMVNNDTKYVDKYNAWERERFSKYINEIFNLRAEKEDFETFKRIFLNIYANPVVNQLEK